VEAWAKQQGRWAAQPLSICARGLIPLKLTSHGKTRRDASRAERPDLEIVMRLHHTALQRGEFVMAAKALVQTRIDADVKEQATVVLENMGLTVSDAVRILLTRTAKDGALPIELLSNSEAHDAWFRAKVREALEDERPDVDDAAVEAQFAERRATALRKTHCRS
jgi:DNA-damage-inducible protein J